MPHTPALFATVLSSVPPGKIISFGDRDTSRMAIVIPSVTQRSPTDLIMLPHPNCDPKEFYTVFPADLFDGASALVYNDHIIQLTPDATDIDYDRNGNKRAGWVYLFEDEIFICATSGENVFPKSKVFVSLNNGRILKNHKGVLVGFRSWRIAMPMPNQPPAVLFNSVI